MTGFCIGSAAGSSPGVLKDGTIDIQCTTTSSLGPIPICGRIDIQACIIASTFDSNECAVQRARDKLTGSNVILSGERKMHPKSNDFFIDRTYITIVTNFAIHRLVVIDATAVSNGLSEGRTILLWNAIINVTSIVDIVACGLSKACYSNRIRCSAFPENPTIAADVTEAQRVSMVVQSQVPIKLPSGITARTIGKHNSRQRRQRLLRGIFLRIVDCTSWQRITRNR